MSAASCSSDKKSSLEVSNKIQSSPVLFKMGPTKTGTQFVDQTKEYGLENLKAVHLYAVDFDNDHFTDLVILDDFYTIPKFYHFNSKIKKFEKIENPFSEIVRASFLNFADFDHDGILDVVVGSLNQKTEMTKFPPRIFKGLLSNGTIQYKEQEKLPVDILPTGNISLLDYDLDGELDLFIANWFDNKNQTPTIIPNRLLKGKGFHFEDRSDLLKGEMDLSKGNKLYKNIAPTFGATVCDVDKNGFPDILTNSSNGYYNKMWLNVERLNERSFEDYGIESGYAADDDGAKETHGGGNSFFSACFDYNLDGIVDIIIGNLFRDFDPETRDRSAILTGSTLKFPPKFIRSEIYQNEGVKSWSEGDHRGIFIDYNLDGLEDIILENSGYPPDSRLAMFLQAEDHAFDDKAKELGIDIVNPSGAVTIDLNRDGKMDFIVGQTDVRSHENENRLYVFSNQSPRGNKNSIRFHLQGRTSNTYGISGSVFLKTNRNTYFRNVEYNYGSLPSQNEEGPYFAFGEEKLENVTVHWPVGIQDRLGRMIPLIKNYSLKKIKMKGSHKEFNLCEDGRILEVNKYCY